ncbi:helix-turn-helix domain-containing protein [Streptomyces xiamenensis]
MGRRENPVDHTARRRGQLAEMLRGHRRKAGLTYSELAARTGVSQATLKRAASGRYVARRATVEAFVTACGGDEEAANLATGLWQLAWIEKRDRIKDLRAPHPELISDAADLSKSLQLVRESAGAPSLREIRRRSGDELALPVSSAARIANRLTIPADLRQLRAFLSGCGVPRARHTPWVKAWNKIVTSRAGAQVYWADFRRFDRSVVKGSRQDSVDLHVEAPLKDPFVSRRLAASFVAKEAHINGLDPDRIHAQNILPAQAHGGLWAGEGRPSALARMPYRGGVGDQGQA